MASTLPQVVVESKTAPTNGHPWNFGPLLDSVLIPRTLMEDRELLAGAKILWGFIRQHLQTDGRCYAPDETLAAEVGVKKRQFLYYCRQLEKAALLRTTKRPGKTSMRELLWQPRFGSTVRKGVQSSARGGCTLVHGGVHSKAPLYKERGVLHGVLTSEEADGRKAPAETPELPGVTLSAAEWEIDQYRRQARAQGVPAAAIEKHAERMRLKFATAEARRIKEGKELAARIAKAIQP